MNCFRPAAFCAASGFAEGFTPNLMRNLLKWSAATSVLTVPNCSFLMFSDPRCLKQ